MKIWTTTIDCICGKKHSICTHGEEIPSGDYVYHCRSLKVKMDSGKQAWTESDKIPKGAKKINLSE